MSRSKKILNMALTQAENNNENNSENNSLIQEAVQYDSFFLENLVLTENVKKYFIFIFIIIK